MYDYRPDSGAHQKNRPLTERAHSSRRFQIQIHVEITNLLLETGARTFSRTICSAGRFLFTADHRRDLRTDMQTALVNQSPRKPLVTDERIGRATTRINALVGCTSLQLALEIGSIVVEELYSGDLGRWRARGAKEHTLRQLANDPRLGISASAIYRALAIHEIKLRFPEHPMWAKLTLAQIRPVLGLPESEQSRLLELATQNDWTAQIMEGAATESRAHNKSSRGGRPRKPGFARSIEVAERALADEELVFGDLDALHSMSQDQRDELERRLSFVRRRCDELASLISTSEFVSGRKQALEARMSSP
ncbi:hypothetical protein ACNOYE_02190 [Nannocystaceae bacterium ST9]